MTTLLFIDDDPLFRGMMTAVLAKAGFEVDAVADGETAMEHAVLSPPEVVVCDVQMPMLDGWSVVRRLRSMASMALVPVIFLSANPVFQQDLGGFALVCDLFLNKGLGPQSLLEALALARRRQQAISDTVRAELDRPLGYSGDLASIGPASLLALADREGFTGHLELEHQGRHARLTIRDGQVVRALVVGELRLIDDACVFHILEWQDGRFLMRRSVVDGDSRILQPTTRLLLTHARR